MNESEPRSKVPPQAEEVLNEPDCNSIHEVVGPDRILPCGCHVINGSICYVFKSGCDLDTEQLFARPGLFIPIDGLP